ncbi:MAG: hypothetical protein H6506_01890 [Calditrichaeota bacterium]|nr:hypothetical protein [Calditrichota bacterium]
MAGFALAFGVYQSYSELAQLNLEAKSRFSSWEAAGSPADDLLSELTDMTNPYDSRARTIAEHARDELAENSAGSSPDAAIHRHLLRAKAIRDVAGIASEYPQLIQSDLFKEWRGSYEAQRLVSESALQGYNDAAGKYNRVLDSFSGKVISLLFTVPPKPAIPG